MLICGLIAIVGCAIADETNANFNGYNDRTATLSQDDKLNEAISSLSVQIQREPTNITAIFNLALAYRVKGEFAKSLGLWNIYIRLNPTNDLAYKYRAIVYNVTGKYDEAIKNFDEGLRLRPDAYSLANRGFAFSRKGEYEKAAQDFNEAFQLDPSNDSACNNLAWLRATCPVGDLRNGVEAISAATKACALTHWMRWTRVDTLAAAYAEAGDFTKAIKYEEMALKMDGVGSNDFKELEEHLALYGKAQPYRDGIAAKL